MSQYYYILLWNCCHDVTSHYNMTLQSERFLQCLILSKYIQNVIESSTKMPRLTRTANTLEIWLHFSMCLPTWYLHTPITYNFV